MTTRNKIIGAAGAAVLAASGGGIGYALSSSTAGATTTAGTHATVAHGRANAEFLRNHPVLRRDLRRLVLHTVHADLVVHTKHGYVTVEIDKGTVTSDNGSTITIRRPDGPSVSAALTGRTRYFGLASTKITSGDKAVVVQTGGDALVVGSKA